MRPTADSDHVLATGSAAAAPNADREARRRPAAVMGALFTVVSDNYDIVLPVIALAPATAYFYADDWSVSTRALISSWVFVATFLGRPIGAIVFGVLADWIGRRRTTIAAIAGFGVTTVLIGLLPGNSTWGIGALIALIALRFVDGIFLGGGYTGASPLAMEASPRERRGFFGGLIQTGNNIAFVLVCLITLLVLQIAEPGGPDAAYSLWGWRIPFLLSSVLTIAALVHYLKNVKESEAWKDTKKDASRTPGVGIFHPTHLRGLIQVFIWATGVFLVINCVIALMPGVLTQRSGLSWTTSIWVLVAAYGLGVLWYPTLGALSQRIGRRRYMIGVAIICGTCGAGCYYLLIRAGDSSVWTVALLAIVTSLLVTAPGAILTVYITERFPTAVRGVGFGMGYTLALLPAAFYASYQRWLGDLIDPAYTVVALVVIGAIIQVIGALMGPETSVLHFADEDARAAA
ncbi:MFS transporter [Tsukamurella spumae]|uniref:MHS family MFS transporter n=1 Tax=Tsukamurella spumae TaxID=44753 RepID=A0A846WUV3_9ACTN|nr:MFS transporter [Tsukamurella spumae]NKY16868.1 MHS family MFS transporter [Tsukamurella spumae]